MRFRSAVKLISVVRKDNVLQQPYSLQALPERLCGPDVHTCARPLSGLLKRVLSWQVSGTSPLLWAAIARAGGKVGAVSACRVLEVGISGAPRDREQEASL